MQPRPAPSLPGPRSLGSWLQPLPCKFSSQDASLEHPPTQHRFPLALLLGAEIMYSSLGTQPGGAGMEMRLGRAAPRAPGKQPQSSVPASGAAFLWAQQGFKSTSYSCSDCLHIHQMPQQPMCKTMPSPSLGG